MANSSGKQDLIVNIISSNKRFEVANYKNAVIPTNFDVKPSVKERFTEFYTALFDKTVEKNPGAIITEYAWQAVGQAVQQGIYGVTCDPCPSVIPIDGDMMSLGADVIGGSITQGTYVLTRLHARYGKGDMKDDLRFREANPIVGGREMWSRQGLEYGATPAATNNFQARYAIRHWWTGAMRCQNPQRGVWGGPPNGAGTQVIAASKTAFAPRGKLELASVIKRDLWEINYKKQRTPAPTAKSAPGAAKTMSFGAGMLAGLLALGVLALIRRRKR
jgi:MYXO-CTERM domain-containing protein